MPEKTVQKEPGKKPAPSKKPKPQQEVVVQISLSELHPFPDHPFQVREDAAMQETAESVKEYGVLVPALARLREDGGYELIAGHRRKHACELAGLATMPVIVRNIDRDAATIIMVDSNLQRENILPSERAKAYKMKMEAIKRQGARTDLTSPKISAKFRSDDEVGQDAGVSGDTIRNYIALTQLVPELQQMVDEKKIALSPAYQLAALTPKEQGLLLETMTGIWRAVVTSCRGASGIWQSWPTPPFTTPMMPNGRWRRCPSSPPHSDLSFVQTSRSSLTFCGS